MRELAVTVFTETGTGRHSGDAKTEIGFEILVADVVSAIRDPRSTVNKRHSVEIISACSVEWGLV